MYRGIAFTQGPDADSSAEMFVIAGLVRLARLGCARISPLFGHLGSSRGDRKWQDTGTLEASKNWRDEEEDLMVSVQRTTEDIFGNDSKAASLRRSVA